MSSYSLKHVADQELLRELAALNSQDRCTTARLLAHLSEVDARRLYAPKAWPSMFVYCVRELRMSEDVAAKRIRAARAARRFPGIFAAIADGRLHLSGVALLAKHLTPENADELVPAAMNRTKSEIELLLAERFPQADVPTVLRGLASTPANFFPAPGPVENWPVLQPDASAAPTTPFTGNESAMPGPTTPVTTPQARMVPLAPQRFALQITLTQETHDQLRYAQALLGHAVPSGDLEQVLKRALDVLVERLEQRKFARHARSGVRRGAPKGRHIPALVRRAVFERDGGQCTFTSDAGMRCEARDRLEFDHVVPMARGGLTTGSNLRLRCRAHNQHEAEQAFGAGFMRAKREASRRSAVDARVRRIATQQRARRNETETSPHEPAATDARAAREAELIPWLRQLGYKAEEARLGAEAGAKLTEASLEQRVRAALNALAPACVRVHAMTSETGSVTNVASAGGRLSAAPLPTAACPGSHAPA